MSSIVGENTAVRLGAVSAAVVGLLVLLNWVNQGQSRADTSSRSLEERASAMEKRVDRQGEFGLSTSRSLNEISERMARIEGKVDLIASQILKQATALKIKSSRYAMGPGF